jgi:hypothetical protein
MTQSVADRPITLGPVTAEALARLSYLLQRPIGCGVVVGPARSGKSALLRVLAESCLRSGAQTAFCDACELDARGLMWELAAQWRIGPASDGSSRLLAQQVRDYLHGATRAGQRLAIVLDHADRLGHTGAIALSRTLGEHEPYGGLTLVWSAQSPLQGDAAEQLLPFTELRIECPSPTREETARFARHVWEQSAGAPLTDRLAREIAGLSHHDLRRAERLSRLSQLAAVAEGAMLDDDMLAAVAQELA